MACERCGTCSRWMWVCEDRFGDMQGVCSLVMERESGGPRPPVETPSSVSLPPGYYWCSRRP